ncbi:MAG: LysM peptidoglycan-binding domain-containing protein [Candidatus Thiodiazotropha sp. (ex Lucina aurantia)]|uniref:LysM domain protein n=2 Tax=Candidatus Thiodiazotropha TaxID=1913444 RepID=A0A7Z0VIC8_9GAMM|nr:LysM peptidoglycan-binding domain-containing protein [Candidatus Thiodiazotropha endolucinida]MBT3012658.1 LysM peptidoglycan-binding domain-containing protein [Candidatus Thiodiazotropha sp. (ex Lucina pensylvanica)]MBT3015256.1 LysM peptidoglycan-binding domain-containing protein [Candidatus Thiodiazotropha taylori]MBT3037762.1 LysM peptidoglycan-binding domain-containing protein [Candidatus Thiodiazotropha sp. (ex Codakia orbicularis)]MBV2101442.1 LysM peptidoglycan-binding domain-contain
MSYLNNKLIGVISGLLLSFSALAAQHVALNPSHPERYTVVKGDTLWDISSMFLRDPWLWPEVWYVNPQIANPHLIYPGDEIVLTYRDGQPVLQLSRKNSLSPRVRATPLDQAIPTIPIDAIAPFLTRPYVVDENELEKAPYIVHFLDDHIVGGAGISYYARSIMEERPIQYAVVRPEKPYKDPDTGEILGYEALYVGTSELKRTGDPAKLLLTSSDMEAIIGDRLIKEQEDEPLIDFQPRVPENPIEGRIISVLNGVTQIGQYNVVVLNKGANVGLEAGHVLRILQGGEAIRDIVKGRGETVTLPLEEAGHLMVFRTFEKVSFALVMDATKPLHVLDWVRTPGS